LLEPTCHQILIRFFPERRTISVSNPSGKPAAPDGNPGTGPEYPVRLAIDARPGLTSAFRVKAFIKSNQWPEYCGSSITGVKKKRREIGSAAYLSDRAKRGFWPVFS
jgi:hypothetical protein